MTSFSRRGGRTPIPLSPFGRFVNILRHEFAKGNRKSAFEMEEATHLNKAGFSAFQERLLAAHKPGEVEFGGPASGAQWVSLDPNYFQPLILCRSLDRRQSSTSLACKSIGPSGGRHHLPVLGKDFQRRIRRTAFMNPYDFS